MKLFRASAVALLEEISRFSALVLKVPLREYQLRPLKPIVDSVLRGEGREFLLAFPRQAGKNEAVAQLLVYLLNLYRREGGNIVYGALGDEVGLGRQRLEARLDNVWNHGQWCARTHPSRICLGKACVLFLSTSPLAATRGQTAQRLLVVDETQSQNGPHLEAVFTPMRAAHNATALYIGTVRLTSDYLWQKKAELEREQVRDGVQRVFWVSPEEVIRDNPAYAKFLAEQVARYGRNHPIVASEYFLEPIDGSGGLFDARRRTLMHGSHPRQQAPRSGCLYVATIDVAGEDEGATDAIAQLQNPARDYTVATAFEVSWPAPGTLAAGPVYRAVDLLVDHGSKHFSAPRPQPLSQGETGEQSLADKLVAWLEHWQVAHVVADQSGVGLGVVAWLKAALGDQRVTGFDFSRSGGKAALGSEFLALIETGRFAYWSGDEELPLSDGWWFWRQVEACGYTLPPQGSLERDLEWGVPASHRTDTPAGHEPTHDDRLISAALVAELDRLVRSRTLGLGLARSAILPPTDPLRGNVY